MSVSRPGLRAPGQARWLPVLVLVALVLAAARGLVPSDQGKAVELVEPTARETGRSSSPVPQLTAAAPLPTPGQAVVEPENSHLDPGQAGALSSRFDLGQGGALFGQKSPPTPAPKPAPQPAAPPAEPAMVVAPAPLRPAFSVIGTFQPRGEPVSLWINQGGQLTLARLGDVIDAQWRIEAIERTRVRLIHTSLATPAELPLPAELAR